MADAHLALETQHVALLEHVPHQAVVLAQVDAPAFAGEDAGGILAAVLQDQQTVIDGLVYRTFGQYADDAAHAGETSCA